MRISQNVLAAEGLYCAKELHEKSELEQAFRLRHEIFCRELGWVAPQGSGLEVDGYDLDAVHFGVFDGKGGLNAYLRLVITERPFMLEDIFGYLVGDGHVLRKDPGTAEISRLCVSPDARERKVSDNFGSHGASMLLYKGVYLWCRERGVRHLYLVVEERILRLLKLCGFPCRPVGKPHVMPDGLKAVGAIMDWNEFDELNARKRPDLFEWFSQARLSRTQEPRLQPVHG